MYFKLVANFSQIYSKVQAKIACDATMNEKPRVPAWRGWGRGPEGDYARESSDSPMLNAF